MRRKNKTFPFGDNAVNEFIINTGSAKAKEIKQYGFCNSTIKRIVPIRRK